MMMCKDMVMKMQGTFYDDYNFKLFLYEWHVTDSSSFAYAFVLIFLLSVVVEVVRNCIGLEYFYNAGKFVALVKAFVYFWVMCGAYLLMLAVMTYSTGMFISVTFGHTVGFLIFTMIQPPLRCADSCSQSLKPLT